MRIPVATYRFQFHKGFNFQQARALIPYLRELGISDVYASPIFLAGTESTHGYDICGFDQINPNLGTKEDFDAFSSELKKAEMGLLADMVPNHMGSHATNCWWVDVLKNGRNSKFASYFDIQWDSPNPLLHGKVLLPVLGDHYGAVLERGELQVVDADGEFHLAYFDKQFPLSPESIAAFQLAQFAADDPNTHHSRKQFLTELNGKPGEVRSFDRLHELIDLQHYRLAFWRVGPHEINYRRFFDVTELVSVRVEDEKVFHATHKLLINLVLSSKVTGLRIDHPDGLRDPKTYFDRLQKTSGEKRFILAEKILSDDERLPQDWPIHGTTGYDYLNYLNGVFVQSTNEKAFTAIYSRFTGCSEDFESLAFRSKQDVLNRMFIAEVNSLTARLKGISAGLRNARDFTESELRAAIIDFIAGFPVYRTYVSAETRQLSGEEVGFVQRGLREAKARTRSIETRALDFLASVLSLERGNGSKEIRNELREFVIRFQQLSGPATAKGLEDTAFYRYTRFVSLNEVGGNPGRFGISPAEFHTYNIHKQQKWPHSMLATSTHDTKRGEDTRARLNVLSEMPVEWERTVNQWRTLNEGYKKDGAPAAADEYLLYQSLVGTWTSESDLPTYIVRIQNYMLKAIREAKKHTSWTEPNGAYESAIKQFIMAILNSSEFRASLSTFAEEIAYFGMFNSIAQIILKICSPGVPDFYQGTEHWDLTLVDPDNRRPIDYSLRQQLLSKVRSASPSELLRDWQSGAIKVFTTANALRIRGEHNALTLGDYRPIEITGARSNHLVAFARTHNSSTIIVAVPRFVRTLTQGERILSTAEHWKDTRLEFGERKFRNLLTREETQSLSAADLFKSFPGAILLPLD
jgi:(1->4)-alpha-D-glucan 1-alpha-D-glucosylmutase